jgi:tripartite-type tricarboxylate transporter receptor subunit TctC
MIIFTHISLSGKQNKGFKMKIVKTLVSSSLALGMLLNIVNAKEVDFEGKIVEWVVPFKAGGGSDKWARFYAPLIREALPGHPAVIINNMPGGGSTKGANYFAHKASSDGLNILGTSGSTQFPYLLEDKRVNYDYKDWTAILGSPTGGVVYVPASLGIKTIDDIGKLKTINLKYGSQGATSLDLIPLLAFDILGFNVDAIFGMKGRKEGRLSFLRGETNIDYQTSSAYLKEVIPSVEEGKAIPLFSFGTLDEDGNLQRDPTFPNLPHFGEVYEKIYGKKLHGQAFNAWKTFFAAGFSAQKMILLPKNTSEDVVETYRKALEKLIADPKFKNERENELGIYTQAIGAQAQKLKDLATTVNNEDKQWIKNWLSEKYNVRF